MTFKEFLFVRYGYTKEGLKKSLVAGGMTQEEVKRRMNKLKDEWYDMREAMERRKEAGEW